MLRSSFVVHINFAKTWRGGERQVAFLFQELRKTGIRQILFCYRGSALHKYCIDNNFAHVSFSTLSSFLMAPFFLVFYRFRGPLIIHCHESKGQTVAVLGKLFSVKKIKIITHRRVLFPIKKKLTSKIKYSENYIDKMICISHAVEKAVRDSIGFRLTIVVPSCISVNTQDGGDFDVRKTYDIAAEDKIIVYIAALTFEKDHATFLKTAAEILRTTVDVHFLVVGEGPLKTDLEQQAISLNIEKQVTFTGFLKQPERIIPQVDVLLFTSRSEGLGSTILDFFVYQKPVVSVRNGGAEEIITEGETGLLSSAGDYKELALKVIKVLSDKKLTKALTDGAYKYVINNHTPEQIARQTVAVYREVEDC